MSNCLIDFYAPQRGKHIVTRFVRPFVRPVPCPANEFKTFKLLLAYKVNLVYR